MRVLCNNCNLNCNINDYKERIENLLIEKNNNLLDKEIIDLSESLSKLISDCIVCNSNNLSKSKGRYLHEKFYYYGDKHLLINLYFYIDEAIKNNQLIYISMGNECYERLMDAFMINRVSIDNIIFKPIEEIMFISKAKKYANIKDQIDKFFDYNTDKYNGIIWIVDTEYIGIDLLENNILGTNNKTRDFIKNMDINICCIFNAYECMNKDKKLI